ncbi:microcephalin isoform X2 [Hydra vulgaris]|uniref:Microcephalin isoform X2 n=1 Tax=Hydra vulgaris TaxID=6087 RepID=A0ABM4D441_HYDVU
MELFSAANNIEKKVVLVPQTPGTTLYKDEKVLVLSNRSDVKIDHVQNQCKPLHGIIVFVDVRAEHENRSKAVSRELEKLGATISEKFTKNVTHVVFKDGRPSTYNQVRKYLNVFFVSILWVDSCKSTMSWVDEALFPAKVPQYIESPCQPARAKRIKSLQPKSFEDEMCNSAKKAKRKRDRLNKMNKVVDTPDQIICHDSQEYAKSSDLYKLLATPRPVPDTPWIFEFINSSNTEPEVIHEDVQCKLNFDEEVTNHCNGASSQRKKIQKKGLKVGFNVQRFSERLSLSKVEEKLNSSLYEKSCCTPLKPFDTPEILLTNCVLNAINNNNVQRKNITENSLDLAHTKSPRNFSNYYEQLCGQCGFDKSQTKKIAKSLNNSSVCSCSNLNNENPLKETLVFNNSINYSPKTSLNESDCCLGKIKKKKLLSMAKVTQQENLISPTNKKGNVSLCQDTDEVVNKSAFSIPLMEKLCLLSVKDTDTNDTKQLSINCFNDSLVTKTLLPQKELLPSRSSERLKSLHRRSSGGDFKVTTMKFRKNKSVVCENTQHFITKKCKNMTSSFPQEISNKLNFSSNKDFLKVHMGSGLVENSGLINPLKLNQEIIPDSKKFINDNDSGISDGEIDNSCLIKSHQILHQSNTYSKLNPSLVATSLHSSEHDFFKAASKHLGGFQLRKNVFHDTTHVVSGSGRRTLNVLYAIIKGCWLLSPKWVSDSYNDGKWLPEDEYELVEYFPAAQVSRSQRFSEGRSRHTTLFSKLLPIYLAEKTFPSHEDLEKLILECGGKLTASLRKAGMGIGHIRCRRKNFCAVSEKWLLDSISNGQVLSTQSYEIQTRDRDESPEF